MSSLPAKDAPRHRETLWAPLLGRLLAGARQAVRRLAEGDPSAILIALCLSVGLALNAAAFAVFSQVLLRPLPYPNEERLVLVFEQHPSRGRMAVTPGNFVEWERNSQSFERATAFLDSHLTMTGHGNPVRVRGQEVIRDFFEVYGVAPLLGSVFQREHYTSGASQVTVLGYGLWQDVFGGDPSTIGKTVEINHQPYRVIGVMPRAFELWNVDLWIPWVPEKELWTERRFHYFPTLARLKPGVSVEQARAELSAVYAALELESPDTNAQWRPEIEPLRRFIFGESLSNTAAVLQAAVLLVLGVACINSMFLVAATALERERESMVRVALGATRLHRAAESLGEALAINLIAIALGIFLAYWLVEYIAPFALPTEVPVAFQIGFQPSTVGFVVALAGLVNVCLTLPPLVRSWRLEGSVIGHIGRGVMRRRQRGRRQLLVLQIAFTTVLVVVATVMTRVEAVVADASVGFDPEHLLVADLVLPEARYKTSAELSDFTRTLVERVSSLPGVMNVATTSYVPLTIPVSTWRFAILGAPPLASPDDCSARPIVVSTDFFRTLKVALHSGRVFTDNDHQGAERAAVVNSVAARNCWRSSRPVDTKITINGIEAPFTIVGVVGVISTGSLGTPPEPTIYVSQEQLPQRELSLVVRTTANPLDLAAPTGAAVQALDPNIPIGSARTLDEIRAELLAPSRVRRTVMLIFAFVAIALSALGLYATSMQSVLGRAQELGVRSALGAEEHQLTRFLLFEWLVNVSAGVLLGGLSAAWITRVLAGVRVGIEPAGFMALLTAAVVVCGTSVAATYWPIRRYGKADAASLLRGA